MDVIHFVTLFLALWALALPPTRATAPEEPDLDAILKAGPLMETLAAGGAFRTLASDALVRNADDLFILFPNYPLDTMRRLSFLCCIAATMLAAPLPSAFAQLVETGTASSSSCAPPPPPSLYSVPFRSAANEIDLVVTGSPSRFADASILVRLTESPTWTEFATSEIELGPILATDEAVATFSFALLDSAPVDAAGTVRFVVLAVDENGGGAAGAGAILGERVVRLEASPPETFTFLGAYPNPFGTQDRQRATLAYLLAEEAEVRLEVFDILGRRVSASEAVQAPGRRELVWDASRAAAGTYLWHLAIDGPDGQHVEQGRFTLVR